MVDIQGNVLFPYELDDRYFSWSNDIAICSSNGKYGVIDIDGNIIIPFIYDTNRSNKFINSMAIFGTGSNRLYHDNLGNMHIESAKYGVLNSTYSHPYSGIKILLFTALLIC